MRPEEGAAGPGLMAIFEEPVSAEPVPAGELPDWLRVVQPVETAFDATQVEEIAAPASKAPAATLEELAARSSTAALVPVDWWAQVALDTEEEPLRELPEPYLSPRARAAEKAAVVAKSHHPEDKSLVRQVPQTGPLRQTGPVALPDLQPVVVAAVAPDIEQLLSRIYRDQQDYAARLDLARMYWATGNREGAYQEYSELVAAGEFTRETMADLETIVEVHDQPDWHRMLGDVYMKAGRLSHALSQYRKALNEIR
jgi:tetratricopeptide (TPR) repeat protein